MDSTGGPRSSFFLVIKFLLLTTVIGMCGTSAAFAQNAVPPSAQEAARMPQFASRLAHPAVPISKAEARQRILQRHPTVARSRGSHPRPFDDQGVIYENGPVNGTTDAWIINFGFVVSDSITVPAGGSNLAGFVFAAWLFPGDTLQSTELSITSDEFGGTTYFDQTVNLVESDCTSNQYGYNICTETASFTGPHLDAGNYWVNLQNATVPSGDPAYWDENSGAGCNSPGCPSLASENELGTVPSEAFTLLGTTTTTTYRDNYACPDPQPGFSDLHDFGSGSSGVAIDRAGNLYGTFPNGGSADQGLLYELSQRAGNWFFSTLYSFLGGSNGSRPEGVIVGPQGDLYGAAQGAIQTCGNDGASYCGLIYEARPSPTACATALCGWNQRIIYQFTGSTDAWGGKPLAFDSAGNLYGVSQWGGAYGHGAIFELMPSSGSWTERVVYSFREGIDGGTPSSLVVGRDGNLYGTASGGGKLNNGVVFRLTPSGGGWTEGVLYAFTGTTDGESPGGLVQDNLGNLYGYSVCYAYPYLYCGDFPDEPYGLIFSLSLSGAFSVIYNNGADCGYIYNPFHALTINGTGNLYAAEGGYVTSCNDRGCYTWFCGKVVSIPSGAELIVGNADIFGNLTSDANGHLYGTTDTCGGLGTPNRDSGMVWQYGP